MKPAARRGNKSGPCGSCLSGRPYEGGQHMTCARALYSLRALGRRALLAAGLGICLVGCNVSITVTPLSIPSPPALPPRATFRGPGDAVTSVALSPDRKYVAACGLKPAQ